MVAEIDMKGLVQAVIDNPNDDDIRLIYADALEEQGTERATKQAELIRVQIELVKDELQLGLRMRESELLAWASDCLVPAGWWACHWTVEPLGRQRSMIFYRGFPETAVSSVFDWQWQGKDVVRVCPTLRWLKFTDGLANLVESLTDIDGIQQWYPRYNMPWTASLGYPMVCKTIDEAKLRTEQLALEWAMKS